MYKVELVKSDDNPSDKVVTLKVNADLLGPFGKLAIPKGSALIEHCPLAQILVGKGDIVRMDIFAQKNETYISIARKVMTWNAKEENMLLTRFGQFFNSGHSPIYLEALKQDIQQGKFKAAPLFDSRGDLAKNIVTGAFFRRVNPVLASHGGAMELQDVRVSNDGNITGEVIMLGACGSCDSAEERTLKEAEVEVSSVLQHMKADNPSLSRLSFAGMKIIKQNEIIMMKP